MTARTWVGRPWRGLTAHEEKREKACPEEHQERLGFLYLLHSEREHTSRP